MFRICNSWTGNSLHRLFIIILLSSIEWVICLLSYIFQNEISHLFILGSISNLDYSTCSHELEINNQQQKTWTQSFKSSRWLHISYPHQSQHSSAARMNSMYSLLFSFHKSTRIYQKLFYFSNSNEIFRFFWSRFCLYSLKIYTKFCWKVDIFLLKLINGISDVKCLRVD